jgi:DNA-binding PadR family transcriptional regulator
MNLSRLVALGILAAEGPLHGHAIRRRAEKVAVDRWGGVSVGALYRELHRLEDEGLIAAVLSERAGRRPERTVYRITDEGWRELAVIREAALRERRSPPDPVGVSLLFAGPTAEPGETRELMRLRQEAIRADLEQLRAEYQRLEDRLTPFAKAVFRRRELLLAAELAWHEEALASLDRIDPA